MSNKGKKINRRSTQEILAEQQLAFAKTVLKANGYTITKSSSCEDKDDWAMDVSDLFKRIRNDLRTLEALSKKNWSKFSMEEGEKMVDELLAKVSNKDK